MPRQIEAISCCSTRAAWWCTGNGLGLYMMHADPREPVLEAGMLLQNGSSWLGHGIVPQNPEKLLSVAQNCLCWRDTTSSWGVLQSLPGDVNTHRLHVAFAPGPESQTSSR